MRRPDTLAAECESQGQAAWLTPPATGWYRKRFGGFAASGLLAPALGLVCALALLVVIAIFASLAPAWQAVTLPAMLALAAAASILAAMLLAGIRHRLLEPLTHLRHWAQRMQAGTLSVRIPEPAKGEFRELARDINTLSDTLQTLSRHMDEQVRRQTEQLAQKTRSLEILYEVAAYINSMRDLNELLARFLPVMRDIVHGRGAVARLLNHDTGMMELVASIGLDEAIAERERHMPATCGLCGTVIQEGSLQCTDSVDFCASIIGQPLFEDSGIQMIAVPLRYRGRTLGLYNLFTDKTNAEMCNDTKDLLSGIGQRLGVAIEQTRLEEESRRLSVMQERNAIANELHDSLAQTLASLRFQARVLDQFVQQTSDFETIRELERVENSLDEAYRELRELITHCRAPCDERGLAAAVEKLVEQFRQESDISIFLQMAWQHSRLPANLEMQVLRIVREALTNARKYSEAQNVRVLLQCDEEGYHRVLVEDDGRGFTLPLPHEQMNEHLGIVIMRERAQHLHGELRIESEPGEGTRIELSFFHKPERPPAPPSSPMAHDVCADDPVRYK
ncbi:MAG: HAMP domain-containing protein, partial [Burkholderiales bacterium]|nr:HAMP domain-containing protein [Burkholderiales bacterium]